MSDTPAGVMPWDMERFTVEQFNRFVKHWKDKAASRGK